MAQREHRDHALLRVLLDLYGERYEAAKRERSALDFEDLELLARDLLADDPGLREQYAERFTHVLVDEFQDTNPLQNELIGLLGRDNLFRVGDENQSIYGFRHADVGVFRDHARAGRGRRPRRAHHASTSAAAGEVLDAMDLAFERTWGDGFEPLREAPGARTRAGAGRARRRAARGGPRREALGRPLRPRRATTSAPRRTRRRPGGRSRPACWPSGSDELTGDGRPLGYGDVVVLLRATTAHVPVTSARSRSAASPPTWSAGAATGASSRWPTCATGSRRSPTRCDELALYSVLGLAAGRAVARLAWR